MAFSPDDRRLLSGGGGLLPLVLWNVQTGQREANLPGHEIDVLSVAISPDGRFAASGDDVGTLLIWDFPTPGSSSAWTPGTTIGSTAWRLRPTAAG